MWGVLINRVEKVGQASMGSKKGKRGTIFESRKKVQFARIRRGGGGESSHKSFSRT